MINNLKDFVEELATIKVPQIYVFSLYDQIVPLHIIECGGDKMFKRGILILVSVFCIIIIFFATKNVNLIKDKIQTDKEVLGYSEYIEYIAWEHRMIDENPEYDDLKILIDISEKRLYLLNGNDAIKTYAIASGKLDTPTPIGTWKVINKAKWGGGFGTRWMGINVPWGTYGIHGTNKPNSIGSNASAGCVRMNNKDVEDLYKYVKHETPVTIINGIFGPFGYGLRTIKPGDLGSDVREIQTRLRAYGYYDVEHLDGKYGPHMEQALYDFQKDHDIPKNPHITHETYNKLGIIIMD